MVHPGTENAAALLDAPLRLMRWTPGFAAMVGLPVEALRPGLPMAPVLQQGLPAREAAAHGAAGGLAAVLAGLTPGVPMVLPRRCPDGRLVEDRWTLRPGEGLLLTCRPLAEPAAFRPAAPPRPTTNGCSVAGVRLTDDLVNLCAQELRHRLPLVLEAAAVGDIPATKREAHALRGVSANFGLAELAQALFELEAAARAEDLRLLRARAQGLPPIAEAALGQLMAQAA
jgi:HPt (histidine-containing phosphotransfer) domain-containing protein